MNFRKYNEKLKKLLVIKILLLYFLKFRQSKKNMMNSWQKRPTKQP
nr:MAG TPA: hypothetical protein [Caudoviricetes sp.]